MNLRQLQFFREVVQNELNVTRAAERLFTSQPGISKQLRQLEDELGVDLFVRSGRRLDHLTAAGELVLEHTQRALREVAGIQQVASALRETTHNTLSLATTQTQARYVLPDTIRRFHERHPATPLRLVQGTSQQIAGSLVRGEADLAIATDSLHLFEELALLPCYQWDRCLVVPPDHPLAGAERPTLARLAEFPLITYVAGTSANSRVTGAFDEAGLTPNIVLSATDAEVIKTYVKGGLGVGIIAQMALEERDREELAVLDAGHLFDPSIASIAFREGEALRGEVRDFILQFAPHISEDTLERAVGIRDPAERQELFNELAATLRIGPAEGAPAGG